MQITLSTLHAAEKQTLLLKKNLFNHRIDKETMANTRLKLFLLCVSSLIAQTTKGVNGKCLTPPINQAVLEGTQNITLTCNSPTKVSYIFQPTSDTKSMYRITIYDDNVAASLEQLFGVSEGRLVVKIAQGTATVPPISTAGLYIVNYANSTDKIGAKVVVSQLPTCGCDVISPTYNQLYCSVRYGDSTYNPIDAKMTWTINGNFYRNATPARTLIRTHFVSTSSIRVESTNLETYECKVTFTKPRDTRLTYIATNVPEFSASCTSPCVYPQFPKLPINQAVYEGTPNTMMTFNSPVPVAWTLKPTTDELGSYELTHYNNVVAPLFGDLFDVNSTGLMIKTAQGNKTIPPISTAGLYIMQINGSATKYGTKFIVVRQPPTCNCTAVSTKETQLICSLTYADSTFHPINATMTWTYNGIFYKSDTPLRRSVDPYYVSTSSILVDAARDDPGNYQCNVAFNVPSDIQFDFFATNAPEFSASCTAACATAPCSAQFENIVLNEGDLNTFIYYPSTANRVRWSILATTDELTDVRLVNYDDHVEPSYAADYEFSPSGLTIRNATTTADYRQHQLSTAGLYSVECGGSRTSFKVLVVESGPTCSKKFSSCSTRIHVTCSSVYADSTYDPIAAVFTLYVDGNPIASDTPQRIQKNAYTWISTSLFKTAYKNSSTYQCVQTFGQPTEVQDPRVAMNAPTFNRSCSV